MKDFAQNYYDLLNGEYKGINLTRIVDFNEFMDKQILDSIYPYEQSKTFKESIGSIGAMLDIGFGGGFPVLPMAHMLPNIKFYGVDTRNKKVKVVGEIADKLGLGNVKLFHARLENVFIDIPVVCTLKAVGKVYDFLSKINTDQNVEVYFFKGPNFYELEKDQIELAKKEWEVIEEMEIKVPGTDKRYLIGFKNKKVPRGTKNIKQLVKLSNIK